MAILAIFSFLKNKVFKLNHPAVKFVMGHISYFFKLKSHLISQWLGYLYFLEGGELALFSVSIDCSSEELLSIGFGGRGNILLLLGSTPKRVLPKSGI
jgi:hypothetical protein